MTRERDRRARQEGVTGGCGKRVRQEGATGGCHRRVRQEGVRVGIASGLSEACVLVMS